MKYIKIVFKFFGWILYFLFTLKERDEYLVGLEKGKNVIHSHDDSVILYGSATKYYFENNPPVRSYLTWKEFWKNSENK